MNECEMLIALIKLEIARDSSKQEEREIKTSESRLCLIILVQEDTIWMLH